MFVLTPVDILFLLAGAQGLMRTVGRSSLHLSPIGDTVERNNIIFVFQICLPEPSPHEGGS